MYAITFTALTYSNLNDGIYTFPKSVILQPQPSQTGRMKVIGGYVDMYSGGVKPPKELLSQRLVTYQYQAATASTLESHLAVLLITDIGKEGVLTYQAGVAQYSLQARLLKATYTLPFDQIGQKIANISLIVEDLSELTIVS